MTTIPYWLILLILFIVSLFFNMILGGGNTGVIVALVFFAVALALKIFIPSTSVYPLIL